MNQSDNDKIDNAIEILIILRQESIFFVNDNSDNITDPFQLVQLCFHRIFRFTFSFQFCLQFFLPCLQLFYLGLRAA